MTTYRRRPTQVEAFQWQGGLVADVVYGPESVMTVDDVVEKYYVVGLGDRHCYLSPGDWVVTQADGVRRVCHNETFRLIYEVP